MAEKPLNWWFGSLAGLQMTYKKFLEPKKTPFFFFFFFFFNDFWTKFQNQLSSTQGSIFSKKIRRCFFSVVAFSGTRKIQWNLQIFWKRILGDHRQNYRNCQWRRPTSTGTPFPTRVNLKPDFKISAFFLWDEFRRKRPKRVLPIEENIFFIYKRSKKISKFSNNFRKTEGFPENFKVLSCSNSRNQLGMPLRVDS